MNKIIIVTFMICFLNSGYIIYKRIKMNTSILIKLDLSRLLNIHCLVEEDYHFFVYIYIYMLALRGYRK